MINRILLDLDGVVRDWCKGIIKLYELDIEIKDIIRWDFVTDFVTKRDGLSVSQFWEGQDQKFWENLELTPEANEIMDLLKRTKKDIILLTSPTMNNAGWSQTWIRKHYPDLFYKQKYMLGPCKYICADGTSLLIDDAEKNVDPFIENGGNAFLFPSPWNKGRRWAAHPVAELANYLIGTDLL